MQGRLAGQLAVAYFGSKEPSASVARLEVIDGRRPLDDPEFLNVRPVDGRIGINATQVRLPAWGSRPEPTPFSAPPLGRDLRQR